MSFIADGLLIAGALTAAFYCWILSVRVKGLKDLDTGLGAAIASLSSQVNEMQTALKKTQAATGASISEMESLADRAETAANQLRLMLATVESKRDRKQSAPNSIREELEEEERAQAKVDEKEDARAEEKEEERAAPIPPLAATARVKQFPANTQPANTPTVKAATNTTSLDEFQEKREQSRALKLKAEVAERISERPKASERDELVQALQDILAANK